MTTGLTYDEYVTQIATLAVVEEDNAAYVEILPQMITYAENRICRDLDFLSTVSSITGNSLVAGTRTLTITAGTIVVCEQINIITPAGQTNPNTNARNPCLPTTKEYLDAVYGNPAIAYRGLPRFFAAFNDNVFYFGPTPDAAYGVEIIGTVRPASLSDSNATTFISLYLPDLLIMASMIYVSGYQRNFGKISDEPGMAMTYEAQYQALKAGAAIEEARKKFEAVGWTSKSPSPVSSPSRG